MLGLLIHATLLMASTHPRLDFIADSKTSRSRGPHPTSINEFEHSPSRRGSISSGGDRAHYPRPVRRQSDPHLGCHV